MINSRLNQKTRLAWEKEKQTIVSRMSWWGSTPMLIHVHKIVKYKLSLKCRCQGALSLLRKNLEHSCDQVLSEWHFQRKTHTHSRATEVIIIQLFCLIVVSKQTSKTKKKKKTWRHGSFISFKRSSLLETRECRVI